MPKVDMELVKLTLQRREELDARAIAQILEELDFEARAGKRESAPLREKNALSGDNPRGFDRQGRKLGGMDRPGSGEGGFRRSRRDPRRRPRFQRLPQGAEASGRIACGGIRIRAREEFQSPQCAGKNKVACRISGNEGRNL